ncbi:MAG: DUF1592 domain-containing protein [Gemmatimonadota bacterium]
MKTIAATSVVLGASLVLWGTTAPMDHTPDVSKIAEAAPADVRASDLSSDDLNEVVQSTCVRCHSERRMTGNLSLEDFDVENADLQAQTAERMIRKLRAGMMPPPGARAPAGDTLTGLVETLESVVDEAAERNPTPGTRTFQRLNQPEYERAIESLLGLQVDASQWLPADQISAGFDNIADVQALSPMLLESYLNAAADISRMALGDRSAGQVERTYKNSEYMSQHPWDRVEGAPYGTRGGMVFEHSFPADGEYYFQVTFASGDNAPFEDLDISIDGERVALLAFTSIGRGADGRGAIPQRTEPVFVPAGQHKVSAAFVRSTEGPYEDLMRPHDWSMAGGGAGGGGITTLPHLRDVVITGPLKVTGVSESESRARIFTCRPINESEEEPCAREIIERLASQAYRRPVTDDEIDGLMWFYEEGTEKGGFERGVRDALEAILASPFFTLRLERTPDDVEPGEIYGINDMDLASRLSFFLWGTPPDEELRAAARDGKLSDADELERHARRMLEDPRADALSSRFMAQWLRLQDLYKVRPDPNFYPNFDENLADDMHRETQMLFNHLVDENKDVLELYTADYTFANARLAAHYGIRGVGGDDFRMVQYPEGVARSGILGHGSILVLTSLANRTSPVLRGKWVMEVLLGTPPPPPPPNVPTLDESSDVSNEGRVLTTRERMEQHRANPTCNSCHSLIDPIGLALDNYDVTGKWRLRENGTELDTRGDFYDGTPVDSPTELVSAIMKRPLPLVRTFTENLMAYAIGRRMEYYDNPTIRKVVREAEEDGAYPVASLILGVVTSDAFRLKQASEVTAEAGR